MLRACFCLALACAQPPSGVPEDAVTGLFAALETRNCDALGAVVAGGLAERLHSDGCARLLKEVGGMRLDRVEDVTQDGRDRGAWLVRVRLRNRPEPVLLKVGARSGRWAVVAL